ncbi:MAG: hypothetical protein KDC38_19305, partial [Planctomycetes bacterium]|nr:hypothetical protein [Planctomycetota bacterium]
MRRAERRVRPSIASIVALAFALGLGSPDLDAARAAPPAPIRALLDHPEDDALVGRIVERLRRDGRLITTAEQLSRETSPTPSPEVFVRHYVAGRLFEAAGAAVEAFDQFELAAETGAAPPTLQSR